jgi:hypothetical protein
MAPFPPPDVERITRARASFRNATASAPFRIGRVEVED